jgi:hypothetical protein
MSFRRASRACLNQAHNKVTSWTLALLPSRKEDLVDRCSVAVVLDVAFSYFLLCEFSFSCLSLLYSFSSGVISHHHKDDEQNAFAGFVVNEMKS